MLLGHHRYGLHASAKPLSYLSINIIQGNPQHASSGWGLSLFCLSAKFEDKDVHNRLIEGVGHLLLRYVPFQFVMTQTAEVEDMVVVLSTVVSDGVNVVGGHSRPLTTAGTVPLRSHHSFLPAQTPSRNATQTANVPAMAFLLVDMLLIKDKDSDDGESESRRKSHKILHDVSPSCAYVVPFWGT